MAAFQLPELHWNVEFSDTLFGTQSITNLNKKFVML